MSEKLTTEISDFNHPDQGYIVIAPLAKKSRERIADIQAEFKRRFGDSSLWLPSDGQLHITFAHIITPNVEYPEDAAKLFERLRPLAGEALRLCTQKSFSITSTFYTIAAYPSSVIIKAHDDGSFDRARKMFTDNFALPEGTRTPPNIIHSTLCRFREELDLVEVQAFTEKIMRGFKPFAEQTTALQLIHEQKIYVQEHEVLETFPQSS